MKVAILTTEQKDILYKQKFTPTEFFNPVQDVNGDWVVTEVEINSCVTSEFMWIKNLELTNWLGSYIPPEPE